MNDKNGPGIQLGVYWICSNWPLEMYYMASIFLWRVASLEQNMHKLWFEAQKIKHFGENQVL
jgi:hypothetical protein